MSSEATRTTAATKTTFTKQERSLHLKHAWKLVRDDNADLSSQYLALRTACDLLGLRHCSAKELHILARDAVRKGAVAFRPSRCGKFQPAQGSGLRLRPSVSAMLVTGRVTVELCW